MVKVICVIISLSAIIEVELPDYFIDIFTRLTQRHNVLNIEWAQYRGNNDKKEVKKLIREEEIPWQTLKYQLSRQRSWDGLWWLWHRRVWTQYVISYPTNDSSCNAKKFLPQVDSTNKFSKDLPGEHEHGPGSQVYPNDNTHSAWTQHILKDKFATILFCKKQLLFWTKYYENVKWSQPWSWGWCREEERCWSQRFEKASVCRQDASSQCGETDRLVETLDWSWIDGSIKKMVNQHFDINLCLGWSPVGAISSVPEPCFEKPSGSLQGKNYL